jgi:hypothetical protein
MASSGLAPLTRIGVHSTCAGDVLPHCCGEQNADTNRAQGAGLDG